MYTVYLLHPGDAGHLTQKDCYAFFKVLATHGQIPPRYYHIRNAEGHVSA